jgi:hypothetical protein
VYQQERRVRNTFNHDPRHQPNSTFYNRKLQTFARARIPPLGARGADKIVGHCSQTTPTSCLPVSKLPSLAEKASAKSH